MLAAYSELIQELPQHPTSCFSRSPVVTPMWAHYANNHSGFVVEFDVDSLKANFDAMLIKDITYREAPNPGIAEQLMMAVVTRKPRHAYFLQQTVLSAAYFSKDVSWSYEQECRLLEQEGRCEDVGGNLILHIPIQCCSAIIVGKNADQNAISDTKVISDKSGISWYREIIGRSRGQPFLINSDDSRAIFDGSHITVAPKVCRSCSEPIEQSLELCPWCSITEDHMLRAAHGNPLRMLDHYGLLEGYYEGLSRIGRSLK
jgi:hypothetical protein